MHTHAFRHTVIAAGDGLYHRFVTFLGTQAGAGEVVLGVAATDFRVGNAFTADIAGVFSVESGGAIPVGSWVKSDASGRAVADDGTSPGRFGRATTAVTGPGQTVFIKA